jgi:hypothetical protein
LSETSRSLKYWLVEKICSRLGSAARSRSNNAAMDMGLRAAAIKRSRLLIAMSGSARLGAAAANCSLICESRSSVTPCVAIRVKLAWAAGRFSTHRERNQGSAALASSRHERRRSMSIMTDELLVVDDRLAEFPIVTG